MRLSPSTKRGLWLGAVLAVVASGAAAPAEPPELQPVPFSAVHVRGEFWAHRQRVNREKTIPHLLKMCEQEGRVRNLLRAAGALEGDFEGTRHHDADLFKAIEAASYVLKTDTDPRLDRQLDGLIAAISQAQRDDGYLHTYAQVRAHGRSRPTELNLFAAGHLLHAGAAYFEATGKRSLLAAAARMADLIESQYGPGKRIDVPSHPILETALFRLAKVSGEDRYAKLAMFFINERGWAGRSGRPCYGVHGADDVPLRHLEEARGHVIVTLFLLSGMYDAGIGFDDGELLAACRRTFQDAVTRRMYLTGAMGRQSDERFTEPYALDNRTSIGEGCQSAALMQLAQRLLLLSADACYADVIERVMINNLAANVGLDGSTFYYHNRLAARPEDATGRAYTGVVTETNKALLPRNCLDRQPWFKVPCCPPNVAIAMATIGQYAYATSRAAVYIHQYLDSSAEVSAGAARLRVEQKTRYPWDGQITATVFPEQSPWHGELCLRIPDWGRQFESSGGLYRPRPALAADEWTVRVNGRPIATRVLRRGYLVLDRDWEKGDAVALHLPMPILRVASHPQVVVNRGRLALQRGPTVYCIEAVDHGGRTRDVVLPPDASLYAQHRSELLAGVTVLRGEGRRQSTGDDDGAPVRLLAIPYGVWGNRQIGEMDMWLPEDAESTRVDADRVQ